MPFACQRDGWDTWHSAIERLRIGPSWTCFWCAPTAIAVVCVSPRVPTGGAGFSEEPWQELQSAATSRIPSTWCPPATSISTPNATVSR